MALLVQKEIACTAAIGPCAAGVKKGPKAVVDNSLEDVIHNLEEEEGAKAAAASKRSMVPLLGMVCLRLQAPSLCHPKGAKVTPVVGSGIVPFPSQAGHMAGGNLSDSLETFMHM